MRESTKQTNRIELNFQTVDLDVAGSNPVTHPMILIDLPQIDFPPARHQVAPGMRFWPTCFVIQEPSVNYSIYVR